MPKMKRAY